VKKFAFLYEMDKVDKCVLFTSIISKSEKFVFINALITALISALMCKRRFLPRVDLLGFGREGAGYPQHFPGHSGKVRLGHVLG